MLLGLEKMQSYEATVATTIAAGEARTYLACTFAFEGPADAQALRRELHKFDIGLFEGRYRHIVSQGTDATTAGMLRGYDAFRSVLREVYGVTKPAMKLVRVTTAAVVVGGPLVFHLAHDPPALDFGMRHCRICLRVSAREHDEVEHCCADCA